MTNDADKNAQILNALIELNQIGKETNRQLVESRHETSRLIDTMMNHDKNVDRANTDLHNAIGRVDEKTEREHKEISREVAVSIDKNSRVLMYGTAIVTVVGALIAFARLGGMI